MAKSVADAKVGQRVCITGYGTAATLHTHAYIVGRLTKTLLVAQTETGSGVRRFRLSNGSSVPYGPWGGSKVSLTCTKKEAIS